MIEPLALATNETLGNASSTISGSASAYGLFVPLTLALVIAVALVFIGSEVQRIQWLHEKLQAFSRSLYYTAVGLASTIALGAIAAPLYYLSQTDGQTQTYVGYAVVGLVAGYTVLTGLGYVVDRLVLTTVREYRETTEPVEAGD